MNDMYVARVITLDHIPASEAVTFVQPVVSKDGYISAFGPSNMVLVVDSSVNIRKILGIIEMIDTDQQREGKRTDIGNEVDQRQLASSRRSMPEQRNVREERAERNADGPAERNQGQQRRSNAGQERHRGHRNGRDGAG